MSKATLSKELAQMDAPQLRELILTAYSKRKDFKEYLEYFLNPDPALKFEKSLTAAEKEINRFRRGHLSKARVSVLNKIVKDFESYEPGEDMVMQLRWGIILLMMSVSFKCYMSATQARGTAKMIRSLLEMADKENVYSEWAGKVDKLLSPENRLASIRFRQEVQAALIEN